jgi:membrane protein DedA with SNARE-associated domain
MEDILIRYGLLAVFLGAMLEGDVSVILAGVVAHLGFFDLGSAIVVGACGAMVADLACYGIGRVRAATIRDSATYRRVAPLVERLATRTGPWEVALARFIYGTRIASMLFWGMRGLPAVHFVVLDLIGCALWSSVLTTLGFATSGSAALLLGRVKRAEHWLLASLLLAAGAVLAIRWWARRRTAALSAHQQNL